jgi:hypothetical protein
MAAQPLVWWQPDDYHQRSSCGRFSVSRHNGFERTWYIAWLWPKHELGVVSVARNADNDARRTAIQAMKAVCDAHALTLPTPKATVPDPTQEKLL